MSRAHRLLPLGLVTLTLALIGCPVAEPTPMPLEPSVREGRWALQISGARAFGDCGGAPIEAMGEGLLLPMDIHRRHDGGLSFALEGLALEGAQRGRSIFAEGELLGGVEPMPYPADVSPPSPGEETEGCGCACDCWEEAEPLPEPCGDGEDEREAHEDGSDAAPACGVGSEPGGGATPGSPGADEPIDCACDCADDCRGEPAFAFLTLDAELRHAEALEGSLRLEVAGPYTSCLVEANVVAAFLEELVWIGAPEPMEDEPAAIGGGSETRAASGR